MLIYVAGPYTHKKREGRQANIERAKRVAAQLWEQGHAVICPHANTAHFEELCNCSYEDYMKGDFAILSRCDLLYMLKDWKDSAGAVRELAFAQERGIPVCYEADGELPEQLPTEVNCPAQTQQFIDTIMRMYRLHVTKNHDYSPANLLVTGEIGLVTRLWDKIARLLNLTGFKFVASDAKYEVPKDPKHESIEDTLMDAGVYSIIGLILRSGAWGR
ncbi:MAG: DUF1937 family protein [Minisyncoccota bacterium]